MRISGLQILTNVVKSQDAWVFASFRYKAKWQEFGAAAPAELRNQQNFWPSSRARKTKNECLRDGQKHGHFPPRCLLYLETAWTGNYISNGVSFAKQVEFSSFHSAAETKTGVQETACKQKRLLTPRCHVFYATAAESRDTLPCSECSPAAAQSSS